MSASGTVERRLSFRFSARDLLRVAIFAVLFIVVSYAIGMLGIISPLVWVCIVPLQAIVGGIIVILFLTRVQHAGMLMLFAIVVGLFYLVSGNSLLSTVFIVVLGVIAEALLLWGGYRSRRAAIAAYTVFGLSFFTPFLPLLYDRDAYFSTASWTEMGEDYVAAADAIMSPVTLAILAIAVVVTAYLGALLGAAMLRKHFLRAGLA